MLNASQITALKGLGKQPGHFRVNWRPKITHPEYLELREAGMIEEHWTWASYTRPDVGITQAGLDAIAEHGDNDVPDMVE